MVRAVVFLTVITFVATGLLENEAWTGKKVNKASPSLYQHAVKGEHYKEVTIITRKAGGDPNLSGKPFSATARRAR